MRFISTNPATEIPIHEYQAHSHSEIEDILSHAVQCKGQLAFLTPIERVQCIKTIADNLISGKDKFAEMITLEMGKNIRESRKEIEKCALLCNYYADNGLQMLENDIVKTEASKSYVAYRPLGVILAIMPWNFPFWQVFRFGIPALLAGNYILLKHASNTSGCSFLIEDIFNSSGVNTLSSILTDNDTIAKIISDKRISAVTLTGSTEAGRAVAQISGKYLKKCVLELGGSDPYLILEDADISKAAKTCTDSRLLNAGQSCISAKRLIVVSKVYDQFIEAFLTEMSANSYGDPNDETKDIGPQAREDLRNKLHKQVQRGLIEGGTQLLGCKIPVTTGFYYPPSIVADVSTDNPLFVEEVFGPVAVITKANSENEAIEFANKTDFGLGGAVFTKDIEKGEHIAANLINAGTCVVNDMVKSDPRLPFGGIKDSGFGRELGNFGPREFMNIKTVVIQ